MQNAKCKIKEKAAGIEALRHRVFVLLCAFVPLPLCAFCNFDF